MIKMLDILKEVEKTDHLKGRLDDRLMEPNQVSILPVVCSFWRNGELQINYVGKYAITPDIKSKIYAKVDYIESLNLRDDKSFAVLVHEFRLRDNFDKIVFDTPLLKDETISNMQMHRARLFLADYNIPKPKKFIDRGDSVFVIIREDKMITFMFGRLNKASAKFFDVNHYVSNVTDLDDPQYKNKRP